MADKVAALLLFGSTGDLARRMLLPSLYGLDADGMLPEEPTIIGTARSELTDDAYRERARQALDEYLPAGFYNDEIGKRSMTRLRYMPLDIGVPSGFNRLAAAVSDPSRGLAIFLRPRHPCSSRLSTGSRPRGLPTRRFGWHSKSILGGSSLLAEMDLELA